ncbi:MAG: hypothetical protein PWR15_1201, partial [Bacteroidota bacterium]|nr:hypothetical protein [Bacteroidota bacterium]
MIKKIRFFAATLVLTIVAALQV